MQPATVHLLTAFHALTHRVSLTEDLKAGLERQGAALVPELWRVTVGLLHEADRGAPGTLAEAIANRDGPEAVRDLVSHAWAARAVRLMDALPKTAGAVVEALDQALEGCPWPPLRRRALFEAMAGRERGARRLGARAGRPGLDPPARRGGRLRVHRRANTLHPLVRHP